MDNSANEVQKDMSTAFDASTIDGITRAFHSLHTRVASLESATVAGVPEKHGRVLKHIYDWAQRFGMPALPSQEPKPEPVKAAPIIHPEGFTL